MKYHLPTSHQLRLDLKIYYNNERLFYILESKCYKSYMQRLILWYAMVVKQD